MDRFTRGFVAGVAGGLVLDALDYAVKVLTSEKDLYWHFVASFLYGHRVSSVLGIVTAEVVHLLLTGAFGVLFAFVIPLVTDYAFLLKGALFGAATWFSLYAIVALTRANVLPMTSVNTTLSHFLTSMVFGVVVVVVLRYLDRRSQVSVD